MCFSEWAEIIMEVCWGVLSSDGCNWLCSSVVAGAFASFRFVFYAINNLPFVSFFPVASVLQTVFPLFKFNKGALWLTALIFRAFNYVCWPLLDMTFSYIKRQWTTLSLTCDNFIILPKLYIFYKYFFSKYLSSCTPSRYSSWPAQWQGCNNYVLFMYFYKRSF